MADSSPVITDARALAQHFALGGKPREAWRVGAEHEKIGVYEDGRAIPYEGERGIGALLANSPLTNNQPNGFKSFRAAVWLETDPDRCGLLPFAFASDGGLFERYAEWALDVPMFFVYRGSYLPAGGMTFRQFVAEGFRG